MATLMFTQGGYNFWRDSESELWNVTKEGDRSTPNCAYRLEYIAKVKGVKL